ncbi:MAG: hypothetical protein KDK30_18765 [Leptospiraceae bacterium]|nr:hypothetical protein [Leptospiraceae bacterium]MCB1316650.1 hypothetical protein [Leptospiraceae bacterium]MCB1322163.1 hypothetical protein [Leptospiraceae bacterium]
MKTVWKSLTALCLALLMGGIPLGCQDESHDDDQTLLLLYLITLQNQGSKSCLVINRSTGQTTCARDFSGLKLADGCGILPITGQATSPQYISQTCEEAGYTNCSTQTLFGSLTYTACTQ